MLGTEYRWWVAACLYGFLFRVIPSVVVMISANKWNVLGASILTASVALGLLAVFALLARGRRVRFSGAAGTKAGVGLRVVLGLAAGYALGGVVTIAAQIALEGPSDALPRAISAVVAVAGVVAILWVVRYGKVDRVRRPPEP